MGQSTSRHGKTEEVVDGVRMTPELVASLAGKLVPETSAESNGGGQAQEMRRQGLAERDAEVMIHRHEWLQRALQSSQRVGDYLLTREEEELAKIKQLAEELVASKYKAPSKERPCQAQAAACLQCYEVNADPTLCAKHVETYSTCARSAASQLIQSKA